MQSRLINSYDGNDDDHDAGSQNSSRHSRDRRGSMNTNGSHRHQQQQRIVRHRRIRRMSTNFFSDNASAGAHTLSSAGPLSSGRSVGSARSNFTGVSSSVGSILSSDGTYEVAVDPRGQYNYHGQAYASSSMHKGDAAMYRLIETDVEAALPNPAVRRVVMLCLSAFCVVFQETNVPKDDGSVTGQGSPDRRRAGHQHHNHQHPTVPFAYTRMPGVPSGAARMLWRALIGSLVHPSTVYSDDESVDSVTGLPLVEWDTDPDHPDVAVHRDPSLDEDTLDAFFDAMDQWAAGDDVNATEDTANADKTKRMGLGSLLGFGSATAAAAPAAATAAIDALRQQRRGNMSALSAVTDGTGDDSFMGSGRGRARIGAIHITRKRTADTLYKFVRDELAAIGFIEVVGKRDDEEMWSYYDEIEDSDDDEVNAADEGNSKEKASATISSPSAPPQDAIAMTTVSSVASSLPIGAEVENGTFESGSAGELTGRIKTDESDADVSGWRRREKKKKRRRSRRKRGTQYLQIQRDMQHQYGVHLSSRLIDDGGFAQPYWDSDLEDDLDSDDGSAMAAIAREHATMQAWNSLMADECLKKQYRKRRVRKDTGDGDHDDDDDNLLVGFPSESANEEDDDALLADSGNARSRRRRIAKKRAKKFEDLPPHEPWIFHETRKWPLDDGARYALHMLPAHLMRAGRNMETAKLLRGSNFFAGRVRVMGAQKAALVHRQDLEELERRVYIALENYAEGDEEAEIDLEETILVSCDSMVRYLTKKYAYIKVVEKDDQERGGQESSEKQRVEKVRGEKVRGETGRALHSIGWFLGRKDYSEEALSCYKKALRFKRASMGSRHYSLAGTLHNCGNLYLDRNEFQEAIRCYVDALKIEKKKKSNKANIATTLNSLAMIYGMSSHYDQAIKCYEEALELEKELYGSNNMRCAECLNNLGIIHGIKGEFAEAMKRYSATLRIKRSQLGDTHPEVADSLFSMGIVHTKMGDFASAVDCYQSALSIRKEILGADHEEVARVLHCLGIVLGDMGEVENSIRCYEEALRIRLLRLGDESEDVARTLNNLGQCYYRNEDYNRALECFKGTLRVSKKKLGDGHEKIGDTLNSMGEVYTKLRKFQEAQEHFLGALAVRRKTLGNDHVDTATALHNLGDVYYMTNDYDNAMKSYQEAFRIRYFKLGADDVDTAYTRNNMGVIRLKRGENQEALECFTEALRVRQALLGKTHEKTSDTLHNLGLVYKNLKEYQKAIDMYNQALGIRQAKANGDSCLKSADTLYNIGIVYANSNFDDKYTRALDMFQKCLDTYQDAGLADDHPSIQNTTQWISWATKRMAKRHSY